MRDPTRGQPAVERAVSLGLRAALLWAVLAFAGTEVLSFSLVQLVLFALAFGWLLARLVGRATPVEAPVLLPLVWVGLVLLQRIPLPEFVVEASGRAGSLPGGSVPATLSLAPYETQASLVLWATFLAAFYLSL
ncbi:MAG: hypothetical protein GWN58_03930, partial [Anaerolineae bacterium]|nr:hypothetical protein [Anaerolineae bacterium]